MKKILVVSGSIILTLTLLFILSQTLDFKNVKKKKSEIKYTVSSSEVVISSTIKNEYKTLVEIRGEVMYPGIYEFDKEYVFLYEVIDKAGGLKPNADMTDISQLQKIYSLTTIYIASVYSDDKKESYVIDDGSVEMMNGKININTASIEELMTLPLIGTAKATMIINYRNEHGNFQKIEDLLKVNGIADVVFNKIKEFITVG